MKTCTKCGEIKPLTEFHKQKLSKHGVESRCKACKAMSDRQRKVNNREQINAWKRAHHHRHKDRLLPQIKQRSSAWYENNKEHKARKAKEYAQANRPVMNAIAAKRRAVERNAVPSWADFSVIKFFFATRQYMTNETGFDWHVDHVVPLQGRYVCGLHVHNNLRVVPATDNLRKSNSFTN
jgi:hypothetical protein